MPGKRGPVAARMWAKVDKHGPIPTRRPDLGPCWLWQGCTTPDGYGQMWSGTRVAYVHRLAYELTHGTIPPGLTVDHLCFVPNCVNPDHLEAVTQRINGLRGDNIGARNARKQHCNRGHPLSGNNIYTQRARNGQISRRCKSCHKIAVLAYRQRKAQEAA